MSVLIRLFELMAEKKASDLFISAGAPVHIKIDGNSIPVNQQTLMPEDTKRLCYEILKPAQIEK
ncbi:MAG: type IV pili twitching motility protein PilT, partial [Usitatibacteraceae bacterium]